eukprot:jgi/Ulvmu1/3736/UM173_0009.1
MAYDHEWNEEYWMTRPVTVTKRLITIGIAFVKWRTFYGLNGEEKAAEYLKDLLTSLGPAFVKIGQAVSSRPDVVPPVYIRQLEFLQDDIAPFPTEAAFAAIEADLGRPVSATFSRISPAPVAAASLGQVYRATLADSGAEVAVKVQRPHLLPTIALDIFILRNAAKALRRARRLNSNLPALIDDWAASIYREMSYRNELANADEFRSLFSHYYEIYVPRMYKALSTERILTMEWVDGDKPRRGSDGGGGGFGGGSEQDLALVEVGVRCSLEQMLEEGFYHADPHPGNILRMRDGRLCYLDFGMMGHIDRATRQALIRATLHMVNREFEELASDFVTLGLLPEDSDATVPEITASLRGIFDEALKDGVRNLNFGGLSTKLGTTMYKYKFRIPPYYTLLVRSLTILEGIALASDKNYKVLGAAYPWVARRLLTDTSPELRATLRRLLYDEAGMFRFDRMESLLEQAVRTPPPPRKAQVRAAPRGQDHIRGAAEGSGDAKTRRAAESAGALSLLLSEEGAYLRGIMLDEVAKGVDAAVRVQLDEGARRMRAALAAVAGGEAEVGAGVGGVLSTLATPLAGAVAQLSQRVSALPEASDVTDLQQISGLSRLAAQLQALAEQRSAQAGNGTGSIPDPGAGGGGPAGTASLGTAASILKWTAAELGRLSDGERQAVLRLPLDLAGRVSSRAAARTVKLLAQVQ